MKKLIVSIERRGTLIPAGTIRGDNTGSVAFRYDEGYLADPDAAAISVSLPLREEPYSARETRVFFEGMLPEGFTRRSVASWLHTDEDDYISILHGLGRECLGAVRITGEDDDNNEFYQEISDEQVRALAAEGAMKSAELVTKAHLSLTGASGKAGLYYDRKRSRWFLPMGIAPSTHIVKQSHVRFSDIVANEQLSQMTAKRCGIDVAESFIVNTGKGRDGEVLLATKRYDRVFAGNSGIVSGLPKPVRLHQEDFSQALGIPSYQKYEKDPRGYLKSMFSILRKYSSDPVNDQLRLWDRTVFNYLLGNTDAHIKNFSLLYGPDLHTVRLSPAYDMLSTAVYEQSTREMAFRVGEALHIDDISEESFRKAAKEVGLGAGIAMKRYRAMCDRFREALHEAAGEMQGRGFTSARELEQMILAKGGISRVN